jgi:hypothetical protein
MEVLVVNVSAVFVEHHRLVLSVIGFLFGLFAVCEHRPCVHRM